MNTRQKIEQDLAEIARRVLRIPTLKARNMDSLDFHEVGVLSLKDALYKAFEAGRQAGPTPYQGDAVPQGCECPRCGEYHADALVWQDDYETVKCSNCGTTFQPDSDYEM